VCACVRVYVTVWVTVWVRLCVCVCACVLMEERHTRVRQWIPNGDVDTSGIVLVVVIVIVLVVVVVVVEWNRGDI